MPAEFGEPRTLYASSLVHVRLGRGLAYPNGVLVSITARVPEPLSRDEQRALAANVMSFHAGPGHTGPVLGYRSVESEDWTEAGPWGHGGSRGMWNLRYWIPLDPDNQEDLSLLFEWPERAVSERVVYSNQEWATARERGEDAWRDTPQAG